MDDTPGKASRLSKLPRPASAIPKPSGLPRPGARTTGLQPPKPVRTSLGGVSATPSHGDGETRTSRLRASASRDSLRSSMNSSINARPNPRLRASASRDSLSTQNTRLPPKPKTHPPVTMPRAPRALATPQRKRQSSVMPEPEPEPESEPGTSLEVDEPFAVSEPAADTNEPLFKRRLTLTRRPSEVFAVSPSDEAFPSLQDSAPISAIIDPIDDMPPPASTTASRPLRPRPSLTERTMQSLAQIPSSPAVSKKRSNFFEPGRPRSRAESTSSRPGSSYNSDGSGRQPSRPASRPGSSSGLDDNGRPGTSTAMYKSSLSTIDGTPENIAAGISSLKLSRNQSTPSRTALTSTNNVSSGQPALGGARLPSPEKRSYGKLGPKTGSKTVAAKPLKPRASVNGLFKKPSMPTLNQFGKDTEIAGAGNGWDGTIAPSPSSKIAGTNEPATPPSARKSSAALREQIAKARAAKKAAMRQPEPAPEEEERSIVPMDDGFDFGVAHTDPFNLRKGENPGKKVLQQRVATARTTGRLNIAALNLKEIPVEVMKMYDLSSIGANDGSWAESVDLTRFIGADNEFETLDDFIFPDRRPGYVDDDDEGSGNIFGGLETMDLHGNLLVSVPIGFRQLNFLTSLNLSNNRLSNNSLDTISQMSNLRDLKLANNLLFGPLPTTFANLAELEVLDLHGNNVSALPSNIEHMTHLRILNLSENSFESLPFDGLSRLPLTELLARKNKLRGTLIEDPIESLPHLQTLDVSSNQIVRLVELDSAINLPMMHALSLSMNRLQSLPDMTSWSSLLTLTVDENSISSIPNSFTSLEKLRHADFSGNDIRVVPPEISRMDNLSMLRLSGNPLRDKKFVSIATEDLKDILSSRLEPPPPYQEPAGQRARDGTLPDAKPPGQGEDEDSFEEDFATPPTSAPNSPARSCNASLHSRSRTLSNQIWPVKQGGLLDRSNTESSTLHPVVCSRVAAANQIRSAQLHHNLFTTFPSSLGFFAETLTVLSLANNQLTAEGYLVDELELPALTELNISHNRITSLKPLAKYLKALNLEKLDVSFNRLNALPDDLRDSFPQLTVLLVPNNHLIELTPESITGLRIVNATNNDISHLNPKIGLLAGEGGLEKFEVMGNRFRVPRFNVLERGTEATLRWLRGRVPVAEMAAWKGDEAEEEEDGGWP